MGKVEQENFQEFYTKWIGEQRQELGRLLLASNSQTDSPPLPLLVSRSLAHYEEYYKTKSNCAKTDALLLLSPPWISQLEDAFIWVGGWRPTAAFHLLYSKSGLQLEAKFGALGVGPLDLSDLTAEQLGLIDKLQRSTVAEERRITEKVAKQQESVADAEMVELSQVVSEARQVEEDDDEGIVGRKIKSAIRVKEQGFEKVLQSADDLRLVTLKAVVGILSPIQAVHFLIAAGELHLSLHEWGRDKDQTDRT